jgi:hypothetical protein
MKHRILWRFLGWFMVFTSRNWFAMQGPVAIILISWNVIFIWETGYWTRAIKRFALFDLYHIRWRKCQKYFYVTHWQKKIIDILILYLYTFSLYENASLIIFSAETEYIISLILTQQAPLKRDDFNFKIINFPNMCSNIPASPAYGVYISQLVRYARAR